MTFSEVMNDPALFGPHFPGDTWDAQRALAAATFGEPMTPKMLAIYQECTGRTTAPTKPFSEVWVPSGRRSGKSRTLAAIAVYLACFRDYRPYLGAGERATIAAIAVDRKAARSIMRYVSGLLREVPLLRAMVVREEAESIDLNNGVTIEIGTASMRSTRGYTYAAVLLDECAFFRDAETSANPDEEILAAVRPGLGTIPGAMLLAASSPHAKRGILWKAVKRYYGRDDTDVMVWKAPTLTMNPTLNRSVVDRAYEEDPDAAASEYGAEFRSDLAAFVAREVVDAATVPGRYELPPLSTKRYKAFVDPSGGSRDSMTIAIAHKDSEVAVLDAVREFRPPFSPEAVVKEIAALLATYGLHQVTGDRYAAEWNVERFRVNGVTYNVSEKPKSDIYRDVLPALNSGKVELLDLPRLNTQLCSLERRTARGGKDSIDHPPGAHDDIANAVAGALLMCATARGPMLFTAEDLAAIGPPIPGSPAWNERQWRGYAW